MIIFLYGQDSYRIKQKIDSLKERFKNEVDPSGINIANFDGSVSAGELRQEIFGTPFMATKRLIIVKDLLVSPSDDIKALLEEMISKDTENMVVLQEAKTPDQRSKIGKALCALPYAAEFNTLEPHKIADFIVSEVQDRGGSIGRSEAQYMAAQLDTDLWNVASEIAKLVSYAKDRPITRADIDLLISPIVEDDIFKCIDAIARRDKAQAILYLEKQIEAGDDPHKLFSMITRQFRILIQVKDMADRGITDNQVIAKELNIHPYPAKKALEQVRHFTPQYLAAIHRYLLSLDKGFKNSYANPTLLLETFVAKI